LILRDEWNDRSLAFGQLMLVTTQYGFVAHDGCGDPAVFPGSGTGEDRDLAERLCRVRVTSRAQVPELTLR